MFGLSRQWLLYDGAPVADALVLSHPEQQERLDEQVPEAAHTGVIAGDPCFDRILQSLRGRARYRAALGVDDDRTLIVVSSTWSRNSLLGAWPNLLRKLLTELPIDTFHVAAIAHPNIWDGHGPLQLRAWLADCIRAGLTLIPPLAGWQAALISSDCVIGDFGSVSCYGAALGKPTLLASFPDDQVVTGTAVDRLGRLAPRLRADLPLRPQIDVALTEHHPHRYRHVAELVSSVPGESAKRLRSAFYRLMRLAEPDGEAMIGAFDTEGLQPAATPRVPAQLVACRLDSDDRIAHVERYPAESWPHLSPVDSAARTHLAVHDRHAGRRLRRHAEVLFDYGDELAQDADRWLAQELRDSPACQLAAVVRGAGCRVGSRDGQVADLTANAPIDPVVLASVAYSWTCTGRPLADLGAGLFIDLNARTCRMSAS